MTLCGRKQLNMMLTLRDQILMIDGLALNGRPLFSFPFSLHLSSSLLLSIPAFFRDDLEFLLISFAYDRIRVACL